MELKANELRIGNLIECFGVREVIAIKKYKIKVQHEKSEGHFITEYCPITSLSLKPIPLTEEWLLKFGFKQEENPFWFCNNVISISPSTGTYVLCGKSGREITRTGLKYLHQLQNLHFALTNKELEIKM